MKLRKSRDQQKKKRERKYSSHSFHWWGLRGCTKSEVVVGRSEVGKWKFENENDLHQKSSTCGARGEIRNPDRQDLTTDLSKTMT